MGSLGRFRWVKASLWATRNMPATYAPWSAWEFLGIGMTDPWDERYALPETNQQKPLKNRPFAQEQKYSVPTIHFQGRAVRFRECNPKDPLDERYIYLRLVDLDGVGKKHMGSQQPRLYKMVVLSKHHIDYWASCTNQPFYQHVVVLKNTWVPSSQGFIKWLSSQNTT